MACIDDLHLEDIGTIIRVTVQDTNTSCVAESLDISSATTKNFILKKPDGTKVTLAGVFTTDGTNGQIQYVTIANDLDQVGDWKLQLHLVLSDGTWRSEIGYFRVINNL